MVDLSPFDPQKYIEHVTKTAMLLDRLAQDVHALRVLADAREADGRALRSTVMELEKELAIYKVENSARVKANEEGIGVLVERLKWVSRAVLGTVITGLVSGAVALVFKLLAR